MTKRNSRMPNTIICKADVPERRLQLNIQPQFHRTQWIMHEHDPDINDPSVPHCHAVGQNWKMNIYNGEIFDYSNGKQHIGKLKSKELKELWRQPGFISLVLKEREWYEENYYRTNPVRYPKLPELFGTKKHGKYKICISNRWAIKMSKR